MFIKKLFYKFKNDWLKIFASVMTVTWILVLLFPLYWLVVSSTKDSAEAMRNPPRLTFVLPKDYTIYLDTTDARICDNEHCKAYSPADLEEIEYLKEEGADESEYPLANPYYCTNEDCPTRAYTDEDFIYEALVLQWMLSDRNYPVNLNSITVARVENGKVISTAKLKYTTYRDEKSNPQSFYGSVTEEFIAEYRRDGWSEYDNLVSMVEKDGYKTGLNGKVKFQKSENVSTITSFYENVMNPENKVITHNERILTVKGQILGMSYKGNFLGLFRTYQDAYTLRGLGQFSYTFPRYMLNSVFIAVMAVLLQFAFSASVAYGLSFLVNKDMSRKLLLFFIVTIMLPGIVEQIPLLSLLTNLNLRNYAGILLPGATSATFVILFKGFFDQLPRELREAAKLDGAGELFIYTNVVIPLSTPVFGAVGIMTFLGQWNTFFWPNMLLDNEIYYTFPMIIQRAMQASGDSVRNYSLSLAMSVIATIPTFFMFAFMQKQMRAGLVLGSLKG